MRFSLVAVLLGALSACSFDIDGGSNTNARNPGNETGGVAVGYGEIAVAPNGRYVVVTTATELRILRPGYLGSEPRLERVRDFRISFKAPLRLAFSPKRDVLYVASETGLLEAVTLDGKVLWTANLPYFVGRLEVDAEDRRLVYLGSSVMGVVDTSTGEHVTKVDVSSTTIDLDLLPDGKRAVLTPREVWANHRPTTTLTIVDPEYGRTRSLTVPNCADQLEVTPDGTRAFLAPTTCVDPMPATRTGHDPVSVVDLVNEQFVRNLPGFGPVAVAPDGESAVAFMDAGNVDRALFVDPKQIPDPKGPKYLLMVIDPATLGFRTAPYGDTLPRYAMTPDGSVLVIDYDAFWGREPLTLFDTHTLAMTPVDGQAIKLDNFVMSPDSSRAFAIDVNELFMVDIGTAKATHLPTADVEKGLVPPPTGRHWSLHQGLAFIPHNINILPDGKTLYLRPGKKLDNYGTIAPDKRLCVYSIDASRCTEWFALD